ncbi:MAG: lipopolysaccharide biosynthesis protein [Mariniphaga sp.]|nr:lipopolysaccharide biosynthesis protein [Mariniphaga sp.]
MPRIILELANNSKIYSVGQIFLKGFSIITLPIFTRILSVEDYGIVSLFMYANAVFVVIYSMGIGQPINRYYYENKSDFGKFLSTALSFLFLFQTIVFFSGLFFLEYLENLFGISRNLLMLAMFTSFFVPLVRVYQNLNIAMERSASYTKFQIVRRIVFFMGCITMIYLLPFESYYSRLLGELFIIPFFVFTFVELLRLIELDFSIKYIKYIFQIALPLFPVMVAGIIFGQIDRVLINKYLGLTDTGLFSYAYAIGSLSGIFIVSIKSAWTPKFMHYIKEEGYALINTMTCLLVTVYCILTSMLILFCKEISSMLAPNTFQAAIIITPIILFTSFFSYHESIYHDYIIFKKKLLYVISLTTIFTGLLKLGLNILLIPRFGYIAAAYSSLTCYIFSLTVIYWIAKYLIGEQIYKFRYSIGPFLMVVLSLLAFYILELFLDSMIIFIIVKIFSFTIIVIISFYLIKSNIKKVKNISSF